MPSNNAWPSSGLEKLPIRSPPTSLVEQPTTKILPFFGRAAASSCEAASYAYSVISISSCLSAFLSDNPFAISKFLHLSFAVSLLLALLRNHLVSLYAIFSKRKRCFGTLVSDSEASFYRFALPEDFPYIRSDLKF